MIVYSRWNCQHGSLLNFLPTESRKKGAVWTEEQLRRGEDNHRMIKCRFYEPWLRHRLRLFKTFTYPSVLSQTDQDFRWIGIAHSKSPAWFVQELKQFERMELVLADVDFDAKVCPKEDPVSVNVDTDDAISRTFVADAKQIDFEGETIFTYGYTYRVFTDCFAHRIWDMSPFNIVRSSDQTVLDGLHARLPLDRNLVKTEDPKWLIVVHDKNIANKFRLPYSKRFGINPVDYRTIEDVKRYFDLDLEKLTWEYLAPEF